jgi:hypothetical protein
MQSVTTEVELNHIHVELTEDEYKILEAGIVKFTAALATGDAHELIKVFKLVLSEQFHLGVRVGLRTAGIEDIAVVSPVSGIAGVPK